MKTMLLICLKYIKLKSKIRKVKGGEYFPNEFSRYCEDYGIIHQKTAPCTPQQNGLAERKNIKLVDMVNAMILNAKAPYNL